jgi:hypothetical protein
MRIFWNMRTTSQIEERNRMKKGMKKISKGEMENEEEKNGEKRKCIRKGKRNKRRL